MADDLYEELGVAADATAEEITAAGRRRMKATHPDAGGDRKQFESACRALAILRDPKKREQYDATGDTQTDPEDLAWAQAMTMLTGKMLALVQNPDTDLEHFNIVEAVRALVLEDRRRNAQNVRDTEAAIQRLKKGMARLKTKAGVENMLAPAIEHHIRQYQTGIANCRRQERMLDKALEVLKDYEYAVEPPQPVYQQQRPTQQRPGFFYQF